MIVVSDTSPLHYLILIERDWVLPKLYGRVIAPEAVMVELSRTEAPRRSEALDSQAALLA